jgi:NAD-dependent dihydropyrimidine dehydrogenase PreA subunit
MKVTRNIIEIDEELCNGCGQCIISCAEGALELVDGKAKLVAEKYCDGLGACLGECPTGALKVIQRAAEDFDEAAVEERLGALGTTEEPKEEPMPCGCPSLHIQSFAPAKAASLSAERGTAGPEPSALTHWPVQVRLVPPTAPFLKNADLLIAADCTPIACPTFHRDLLAGRVVLVGCPKFDDGQAYVEKFAGIFAHSAVKSVTIAIMEVPCCSGLALMVKKAMELAGKTIPLEQVVISTRGEIIKRERMVA